MEWIISHNKPTLEAEEEQAAARVIRSGWLAQGEEVKKFEDELCAFLGLPEGHAIAVSSGTAALFLALQVLGARDKKVAFPAYVCAALRNAVGMTRASELLIDNEKDSPNVDMQALNRSGADLAIVPHTYGIPAPIDQISDRIPFIEDCAQALGAKIGNAAAGLHGKVGVFSFYATKLITTGGQGGLLVSRDRALVDAARDYREFDGRRDSHQRFNLQLTDLAATIGRVQLKKLPGFLERRAEIFETYRSAGLELLDQHSGGQATPVRYRAVLKTKSPSAIIEALSKRGIRAIIPLEDWELLGPSAAFPNALALTKQTVSLPLYPTLTDNDVAAIIAGAKQI